MTTLPTPLQGGMGGRTRRTPLSARGEPAVWLMGGALLLSVALIVGLLGVVVVQGLRTFWPDPIHRVTLRSGEVLLGVPVKDESFEPSPAAAVELAKRRAAGDLPAGSIDGDGRPVRRQYRVGNRELGGQPFRWVELGEIMSIQMPPDAVLLERAQWGVWIGTPTQIVQVGPSEAGAGSPMERVVLADGSAATLAKFRELHGPAVARQREMERLQRDEMGAISAELNAWRSRVRAAELAFADSNTKGGRLPGWAWGVVAALATGLTAAGVVLTRRLTGTTVRGSSRRGLRAVVAGVWCIAALALMAVWLERPRAFTDEKAVAAVRAEAAERKAQLDSEAQSVLKRIAALTAEDLRTRAVFTEVGGRFAPLRQSSPDEPTTLAQIVRLVPANDLGFWGKFGVYVDRWREFLFANPREANMEGGVMPVIFGTVLLTLLLSITVVPLGVIAALYLREYAKQGIITSAVRIAVNNLAGVPSIVYGVFGLGFFCYTMGQYIDGGPNTAAELPLFQWWWMAAAAGLVVFGALALAIAARPRPGQLASKSQVWFKRVCGLLWVGAVGLVIALFATTPYFQGFFREDLPANPRFGGRGLLWGALTLALLTLPVVIVATEEAIAAVPRTMREGSYGCGASRWQTIKRIVLPGAMPGIMTGMILAMARGAGEVAPLMIVGAVKLTDNLPVSGQWPFVHLERTFMHLGFHIYDLGFQSPDAEAARPLVWTTTLLLIAIVVLLNLVAITIRTRLRSRLASGTF